MATNLETSKKSIQIAEAYKNIFCTIGLHPNETEREAINFTEIINLARSSKKIIGIGETGLDYYKYKSNKNLQFKLMLFVKHIDLADQLKIPVIVHNRDADDEL